MDRPSVDAEMLRGPVDRAGDFAVLTKLLGVAMLQPVVVAIALDRAPDSAHTRGAERKAVVATVAAIRTICRRVRI